MESKYIEFMEVADTGKTKIYQVLSRKTTYVLGHIRWYGPWRRYCFNPSPNTVFSVGCMKTISENINYLMKERRGRYGNRHHKTH